MNPDMPQEPSVDPSSTIVKAPDQTEETTLPSRIGPESARIRLELDSKKYDLVISMLNRI